MTLRTKPLTRPQAAAVAALVCAAAKMRLAARESDDASKALCVLLATGDRDITPAMAAMASDRALRGVAVNAELSVQRAASSVARLLPDGIAAEALCSSS